MKSGATALLVVALSVYLLSFLGRPGGTLTQFVRAASEAAMVGGLADWFAVTALFRRPLGLPIPHTALIPTRKDALAASLGEFVTSFFLSVDVVREHLNRIDVIGRVGGWLAEPAHARALSRDVAAAATALVDAMGPDPLVEAVLAAANADATTRSPADQAGRLLEIALDHQAHQPLLDLVLTQATGWVRENHEHVAAILKERIEAAGFFAWLTITSGRCRRLVDSGIALLDRVRRDADDPLRADLELLLRGIAVQLRADTPLARDVDAGVRRLLAGPQTREWLRGQAAGALRALTRALADPGSPTVGRLASLIASWGERMDSSADDGLRAGIDSVVDRVLLKAFDEHAAEFTRLIRDTVARWDGRQTAERIELAAGSDLQFIRVNGTVIGALAGVLIHAVSLLLP